MLLNKCKTYVSKLLLNNTLMKKTKLIFLIAGFASIQVVDSQYQLFNGVSKGECGFTLHDAGFAMFLFDQLVNDDVIDRMQRTSPL